MRLKITTHWPLLIVCLEGAVFATIMVFWPSLGLPGQRSEVQSIQNTTNLEVGLSATTGKDIVTPIQEKPGIPVRLIIPKIHVDAAIEQVGLTPDGAMDVPKALANVAWFEPGPRPGEVGSAVIAGHSGWKNGVPAVFDTVHNLAVGDTLFVEDAQGVSKTFMVRALQTLSSSGDTGSIFSASDGNVHLNLITCEGVWSEVKKSFSQRLIVFTDRVE